MNKVYSYIKKNTAEILFLLILDIFIAFSTYLSLCSAYLKSAGFDLQTILTWDYSAAQNLIPYKDLYYPYGLLSYYRNENPFFTFLYLALSILTFNLCFYIFKKVFNQKQITYGVLILFFIFIFFVSGIDTFSRYGVSFALTLIISYIFFLNGKTKKIFFLLGFVISTVFWLVHDQGIYGYIVFILFFLGQRLLEYKTLKKSYLFVNTALRDFSYFLAGVLLGFLPFLFYLVKNNAVKSFFDYLTISLPEFPLLSKTPFFTFLFTPYNLFSILVVTFSTFYVTYKLVIKQKKSMATYIQIGLIILILLFEQKNIIRSIETTFTFVSFALFAVVFWELLANFKSKTRNVRLLELIYFPVLLLIILMFYFSNPNRISSYNLNSNFFRPNTCFYISVNSFSLRDNYMQVIKKLKEYSNFNGKVLSFPGDPIFYVLLKQIPPFFTSVYEASSERSQKTIIDYTRNNIRFVVVNMENKSIQDEVPNYVRGVFELKYILNNFSIRELAGNFLILEKQSKVDFFTHSKLALIPDYKDYLLNVNLENIPFSEGLYKNTYVSSGKNIVLIKNTNKSLLNKFLKKGKIYSGNAVLLFKNNAKQDKYTVISVESENSLSTKIKFKSCFHHYCVINLSNIPLFYRNRNIKDIDFSGNLSVSIVKMDNYNLSKLW